MQVKSKIGCQYLTSWKNENDYLCYCEMFAFSPLTQWFVLSCRTGQRKVIVSLQSILISQDLFLFVLGAEMLVGNKLATLRQSAQAVWQLPSHIPVPWDPGHTRDPPLSCELLAWHRTPSATRRDMAFAIFLTSANLQMDIKNVSLWFSQIVLSGLSLPRKESRSVIPAELI